MPNTGSGVPSPYRQGTKGYKLHGTENTLEIFNRKRADTFIFVTRPPAASGADIATSIALQKISQSVQRVSSPPFACCRILGLTRIFVSNVAESTVLPLLQLRYTSSQTEIEWRTKHSTCGSSST